MINFDKDELYPLLFEPLYKEVMWGGTQLASKLNRPIPEDGPRDWRGMGNLRPRGIFLSCGKRAACRNVPA